MIKPLGNRVVIRRDETLEKSSGGIILTGSAKEEPTRGIVIAVGTGTHVAIGDSVLFGKYAGQLVKINGDEIIIIDESEIFGVVE